MSVPKTDENLRKFFRESSSIPSNTIIAIRQNYIPKDSQVTIVAEVTKTLDGRITLGPPSSDGKLYLITLKTPDQLRSSSDTYTTKAVINGLFSIAFVGAAAAVRWYRR